MKYHTAQKPTNHLKEKLASDRLTACMMVRVFRGTEIARIAHAAGFDALYVDLEHSALSLETTAQICMTAQDLGVTPMVRVANAVPETIGQVLDCGAMGIIVPGVATAGDAAAVVASAKFPPMGRRSVASGLPQVNYARVPLAQSSAWINDTSIVSLMIESAEALANIEAIAAVPGVDILHIGMNDLAATLGLKTPWDADEIRGLVAPVIAAARANGISVGVGGVAALPELLGHLVSDGVRFISAGTDLALLLSAATAQVAAVKSHQP